MSMNATPSANRVHIGFFGKRNAGKSSLVNAVTGQALSIVSEQKGTTTDPVSKAMELLPLGPVVIIDTPGYDDEGELGELRVKRTKQVINKIDIAVLVVDASAGETACDRELKALFEKKGLPYLVVYNKADLTERQSETINAANDEKVKSGDILYSSALTGQGIHACKEALAHLLPTESEKHLVADLVRPLDTVVLVTPIDEAAPKGRLILPQQQMLRDLLEAGAISVVVREFELKEALEALGKKPAMVITDSQAFAAAAKDTPEEIPLTSFSILMARYKGFLETAIKGVAALRTLKDNDTVLIAEGCTHHRQCGDIGSVKLPAWLKAHTGRNLNIRLVSGTEFPEDLTPYALVIHCGGCMLNEREMQSRMKSAIAQNVPFTNYGIAIAQMKGVLSRSLAVFPKLQEYLVQ